MSLLDAMFVKRDHYAHVPHYDGELMEELMGKYDMYPPMHFWQDSLKYIMSTIAGKALPWCKWKRGQGDKVLETMRRHIMNNVTDESERRRFLEALTDMWPILCQKMSKNRGLWKMMCDSGAESLSFAQFPTYLVPRAIALESAFGVNYDNSGEYRELLAVRDLSMRSAVMEPEFVELRRRAYYARQCILDHIPELKNHTVVPSKEKLGTIITVGAGLLIELRKFGMTLAQLQSLNIIACDMDESLLKDLDVVCQHDFGVNFAETGIDYRFCKADEFLMDESLRGKANVFLLDGFLSYCQSEEQMQWYIAKAESLCDPNNSVIFCDLTVLELSLVRCALVQGWQAEDKDFAMHPELSAKNAVQKMQRICSNLNCAMRYEVDSRNPSPLGVVFWLNDSKKA